MKWKTKQKQAIIHLMEHDKQAGLYDVDLKNKSMEKKQTAVDTLIEILVQECGFDNETAQRVILLAKQMEKEQIVKSYRGGAEWQAKQMYSKDELADLIDATFQGRQDVADLFSELLKNLKTK